MSVALKKRRSNFKLFKIRGTSIFFGTSKATKSSLKLIIGESERFRKKKK